jgi:hypothetical protein
VKFFTSQRGWQEKFLQKCLAYPMFIWEISPVKRESKAEKTRAARWETTSPRKMRKARGLGVAGGGKTLAPRKKAGASQRQEARYPETPGAPAWGLGDLGGTVSEEDGIPLLNEGGSDDAEGNDPNFPGAAATGEGTAQPIRQAPGEAQQAITAAEGALRTAGAAQQYVTQEEFDRLLELVSQLSLVQGGLGETQVSNARLEALERRVEEVVLQFRNNRNSGPG